MRPSVFSSQSSKLRAQGGTVGKKRRATSGLCVAVSEDVRAIRQLFSSTSVPATGALITVAARLRAHPLRSWL